MNDLFRKFAHVISIMTGSAWTFVMALTIIIIWGALGPLFHFSDTWQLVINTGTTIITFLMVFLIQNTHNQNLLSAFSGRVELIIDMKEKSINRKKGLFSFYTSHS